MDKIMTLLKDEEGTSMVGWALFGSLIMIVSAVVITSIGIKLQGSYNAVAESFPG